MQYSYMYLIPEYCCECFEINDHPASSTKLSVVYDKTKAIQISETDPNNHEMTIDNLMVKAFNLA